ncbi:hypothetical protein FOA52_015300 [Chlamydomonas sp. UWO 241]|nr:hypothetical protein FOA52_015300 [Chlamydomonas sp. UWO 241]
MADPDGWTDFARASETSDVDAMRRLLICPSADTAALLMHNPRYGRTALLNAVENGHVGAILAWSSTTHLPTDGRTALLEAAETGQGVQVEAMRLLLDHPSADPGRMLMHTHNRVSTALMLAASGAHADATRLLLDHPSANAAAMVAVRRPGGASALTAAAEWAVGADYPSESFDSTRSCEPLLLLLRRVAVESQPCDAQRAHMTEVLTVMGQGPQSQALFSDAKPDGVRDECMRMLLERGAMVHSAVMSRIFCEQLYTDDAQTARMPMLINEAVIGMSLAWRKQERPRDEV